MTYSISVSVIFDLPPATVFEGICRLDDYLLWHGGMTRISKRGRMTENMLIETETMILDQVLISSLEVLTVITPQTIEIINNSGAVTYRVMYRLLPVGQNKTEVVYLLQFDTKSIIMNLARQVVEARAEGQARANLETLRTLLAER